MKSKHKEAKEAAIFAIIDRRLSKAEAAAIFCVHLSTIYRWLSIYTNEGRIDSLKCGGRKSSFTNEHKNYVDDLIAKQPDITLEELVEKLNFAIKKSALHAQLTRLGYIYKKNSESKGARQRRH